MLFLSVHVGCWLLECPQEIGVGHADQILQLEVHWEAHIDGYVGFTLYLVI